MIGFHIMIHVGRGLQTNWKKVQKDSHTSLSGTLYAGKISFVHDYDKKRFPDNYKWRKQFLRSLHKENYFKVFFFSLFKGNDYTMRTSKGKTQEMIIMWRKMNGYWQFKAVLLMSSALKHTNNQKCIWNIHESTLWNRRIKWAEMPWSLAVPRKG